MTLERNGTGTELATSVNFWNWNGASYKNLPKERNGASSISNGALSTTDKYYVEKFAGLHDKAICLKEINAVQLQVFSLL